MLITLLCNLFCIIILLLNINELLFRLIVLKLNNKITVKLLSVA
jgi:hypothetical protein